MPLAHSNVTEFCHPAVTAYEANYNPYPAQEFVERNWGLPIAIACSYLLLIAIGQRVMQQRPAIQCRTLMVSWNLALSAFSLLGAIRTVPHLLHILQHQPFVDSVCQPADRWGNGPTGLWATLFIFSKIPELFDTFFLVIRKRPVIFLHWFHHVTVLLYCWFSMASRASQTLYFIAMNYSVHALMYFYYAMVTSKRRFLPPMLITILQLAQMVVGIVIQLAAIRFYIFPPHDTHCHVDLGNVLSGALMYACYFGLFLAFFTRRFFGKSQHAKPKTS